MRDHFSTMSFITFRSALPCFLLSLVSAAVPAKDQEEPVLIRSFAKPEKVVRGFAERKFTPEPGETIAFLGGTNTFEQQAEQMNSFSLMTIQMTRLRARF